MAMEPKVQDKYQKAEEKVDSFLTRLVASKGTAILVGVAILVILVAAYIIAK